MSGSNPMDALMEVFMVETNDFLQKLEDILLQNEKSDGGIQSATPEIFRIMHTIKSSSAMMSLDNISRLSHKVEDLFYYLREHKPEGVDDSRLVDIVFEAVDFIKRNLDGAQKEDPAGLIAKVAQYLDELKGAGAQDTPPQAQAPAQATPPPSPAPVQAAPPAQAAPASTADIDNLALTIHFKPDCTMLGLRSLEVKNRVKAIAQSITSVPEDPTVQEELVRMDGLLLLLTTDKAEDEVRALILKSPFVDRVEAVGKDGEAAPQAPAVAPAAPMAAPTPAPAAPAAPPAAETPAPTKGEEPVRQFVERRRDSTAFGKAYANVEIAKLDNLVDLVGELLTQQMGLAQTIEQRDFRESENAVSGLKKLILTLQEATLSTRMVPIRDTFLKMNRLVRDMSRKQEKDLDFVTLGEDTEVDRSIIENISSPLMHIIRNSIDHGIESEAVRVAAGKPAKGRIELSASTEGRNVVISIVDDGQGFDIEKIIAKALSAKMITEAQVSSMSEEEIYSLVFQPGFSTSEEVTEYSGRGVGMDVVNVNLKKMNGKVIVNSVRGQGTRVVMKIPLTLAIIDTMILRVGAETCAIPVSFVDKILFMENTDSVRNVNGEDVVLLRDECYKILNLFDFYTFSDRIPYGDGIMLIVGSEQKKYVVFATEIVDRQEVVVKPAPPLFKGIRGISGCTILGDGRISLILDTDELLISQTKKRSALA